jgi:hypothetical protein
MSVSPKSFFFGSGHRHEKRAIDDFEELDTREKAGWFTFRAPRFQSQASHASFVRDGSVPERGVGRGAWYWFELSLGCPAAGQPCVKYEDLVRISIDLHHSANSEHLGPLSNAGRNQSPHSPFD